MNFELEKNVVVHKKIVVNGQEYESLDQVPPEARAAIEKALGPGASATATTQITVNGHTYAPNDLPAPMRAILDGLTLMTLKKAQSANPEAVSSVGQVRAEPTLSFKKIVILAALIALVIWIARAVS
ncbi:MAG TPA: hypothetical protein VFV19_18195 [Candidatus Polarisedimenticolaceae bacterium]|nr:hypothetical protein [Candidatus Polarisedimenticolaceae bacterium]